MASGFFLGGLADSLQTGITASNQAKYQQGLLQLEQQRLQRQEHNDLINRADKERANLLEGITNFADAYNVAHANDPQEQRTKAISQAVSGYKQMLMQQDKILGRDPASTDAQIAMIAATPPKSQTAQAAAEATGVRQKNIAQASEAEKRGGYYERGGLPVDPNNPDRPGTGANGPAMGDANFNQRFAQATQTDVGTKPLPLIPTPMTPQQEQLVTAAGLTPATADFEAVKYAYGADLPAARSKVGGYASNIVRSRGDQYWIDKGIDPQTANAIRVEFKAMQHGAQKVADIDARMTTAVAKAQQTAQILTGATGQQLIDSVDRTQYKDLNDLLVAARKRTGNESEIRLGIALETLASNYGVALGQGNSTLTDFQTQRAQSLLQQGWSKGQLRAAVDQLQKEMVREEAGTRQALKTYIGGMQSTMGGQVGGAGQSGSVGDVKFSIGQ